MMKKIRKLLSLVCMASVTLSMLGGCVVHDGEEGASASSEPALAVTSVAILEILDQLEYDNVIGIPETSSEIPKRYQGVTTIGAPMSPDVEVIASLSPDMVLSPKSLESSLSSEYQTAGVTAAFLDLSSIAGMYAGITSLGSLLGREEQAAAMVSEYESYMASYNSEKSDGPTVLLLMAFPDGFFLAATEDCYVGNLVSLAGGQNVYAEYSGSSEGFVNINPEDMVQKDPDMILVFAHYNEEAAFAYMQNEFATNSAWSYFDAVNEGNVVYLPSEYFGTSATLDYALALDYLESKFYGE